MFLAKRAETKKFLPGVFELPGGHIDFGEDIVEGLKREIREEFGMRVSIGDPFKVFDYVNEIKGSHSIQVIYFGTFSDPIEDVRINPEDHSEFRWIAEDEVEEVVSINRRGDDPEIQAIRRGFALLRSGTPSFG